MALYKTFHASGPEYRLNIKNMLLSWYFYDIYKYFSGYYLQHINEHSCFTDQYWLMYILAVAKDFLQLPPIFLKTRKVFRINTTGFNSEHLEC